MQGNTVSAERVVGAPAHVIFVLLCNPCEHARFDGSETVDASLTERPLVMASRFGMKMRGRRETLLLPYRTTNTVIEFEPDRRIAWQTTALGGLVGGRIWRYDLSPVDGGTTLLRETWDISQDRQNSSLKRSAAPSLTAKAIRATLERIAALVEDDEMTRRIWDNPSQSLHPQ